ncbi:MAG: antibiotic biosynthesis monooxygenase [Rhodospirillales bacterium]|jgi:heme-degrading monooxygenase HmoA|nr:antibiotic biosynthesis monooxygenase [Rhodospirillales bacterium]MBT5075794.1 antibiotic biosynthesis monooxygenase [Rhodospirillales bacterium]MBT5114397.1 antibiotic biosynthesis monooxygenase [Rhodospirillales bacterium]MBT5672789.1 antibiotic biosynthesis monooxygenase [Rhodospirillales bacterium]MBT6187014.1 antibiotic biosynthesis monooxygenase [Rhodospirillales bacterium]
MVTIGMNYHTLPGKQAEFIEKFCAVMTALDGAAGHEESNLFQDVNDDASFLIVSNWSEHEAFQTFIQSDAFGEVTSFGKENLLSERPQHRVYKS